MASIGSVLLTGALGFTGRCLTQTLVERGYEVFPLKSDLLDHSEVDKEVKQIQPQYVIHLAGISSTIYPDEVGLYNVNFIGTCNLLKALESCNQTPQKTILSSTSYVYGRQDTDILHEELIPNPESHYALSKYFLEKVAAQYPKLSVICTRPFNYTGLHQPIGFVVPKLVDAFKRKVDVLPVGNLETRREFNDVRDVANVYSDLLQSDMTSGVLNISSGSTVSISEIVELLKEISKFDVKLEVADHLLGRPDADVIVGSNEKLNQVIGTEFKHSIEDTLIWMYKPY